MEMIENENLLAYVKLLLNIVEKSHFLHYQR